MDETRRFELEQKWVRNQRVRVSTDVIKKQAKEYVSAVIRVEDENVYIALVGDGPKNVTAIKLNAVAAMNIAVHVLKELQPIFPDTLKGFEIDYSPPRGDQH